MQYLHTMVRVADLEQSLKFYRDALGMVEVSRHDYQGGRFTLCFLAAPEDQDRAHQEKAPMLELTHNWEPQEYNGGRNFGHLAFRVDNIYETCQRLIEHGVTINRPPHDGRMAFVRSPDNISIELLQAGNCLEQTAPWRSMQNIGEW